ncbi:unnamed protein product [Blepharisma stoltei]|uniref:Maturase K n=1 Tax=Blepharisma stoltei TaxID=1481888 RepID=A0AAU9ID75_9CILI|nr:unnamed protein product [Blepharisma stoltei]
MLPARANFNTDTQILNSLKALLNNYTTLKAALSSNKFQTPTKEKQLDSSNASILECLSTDSEASFLSQAESTSKPSKSKLKLGKPLLIHNLTDRYYSIDQCWTIDLVFSEIYSNYKKTTYVRSLSGDQEVHIVAIRQFFLDCYVCDQFFLNMLMSPISNLIWVKNEDFFKAIEGANKNSPYFLSIKKFGKERKRIFQLQRMLFFFCFVEYETGKNLGRESLLKVLDMVERRIKPQLEMWVDLIMKKAQRPKEKLSFEDFKSIIIG